MAETIGRENPLRYRGYYYDEETGFYYLQSRYYDPETGRFLNADGEVSGIGGDILGYNLYSYCFNNPVNMSDPSGHWPKWSTIFTVVAAAAVAVAAVKSVATAVVNAVAPKKATPVAATSSSSSFAWANNVSKTHVTTPTAMLNGGPLIGKVGFSTTTTKQNKEPGLVHSYSDIGNDASKYGAGINAGGWLGAGVGVSTELNAFVDVQVTPWVHAEVSLGLDGIGAVIGFDIGDTAYDFELKGGWGLIAIFVTGTVPQGGGSPAPAPAAARFR